MWRRKRVSAAKQNITADQVIQVKEGVDAYLSHIQQHIAEDVFLSLVARGDQIKREWASKALEQWSL